MPRKWEAFKGTYPEPKPDGELKTAIDSLRESMRGKTPDEIVAEYDIITAECDQLEADVAAKKFTLTAFEHLLKERLELMDMTSFNFKDGSKVVLTDHPTIVVEDAVAWQNWLLEKDADGNYVRGGMLTIYAATRDAMAKAAIEAGKELPPGLKCSAIYTTASRRGKKSAAHE